MPITVTKEMIGSNVHPQVVATIGITTAMPEIPEAMAEVITEAEAVAVVVAAAVAPAPEVATVLDHGMIETVAEEQEEEDLLSNRFHEITDGKSRKCDSIAKTIGSFRFPKMNDWRKSYSVAEIQESISTSMRIYR